MEENIPQQPTPVAPPVQQPPIPKEKRSLWKNKLLLIFLIVIVIMLTSVVFLFSKSSESAKKNLPLHLASNDEATKIYKNNYYNFKLDIPVDWKTEEYKIKNSKSENGTEQIYKISSPDGKLVITNDPAYFPSGNIKKELTPIKVQVGEYVFPYADDHIYPFIDSEGKTKAGIAVGEVRGQSLVRLDLSEGFLNNTILLKRILKSFAFYKQDPSLDDSISYIIPEGWTKEDTDVSKKLSFISSDFKEEGLPSIVNGARISVYRRTRDNSKTLIQQMNYRNSFIGNPKFGNYTYLNMLSNCSKELPCDESYSIEREGYVWTITFACNQNCNTKSGMDNTIYAKPRDSFLSSVSFK